MKKCTYKLFSVILLLVVSALLIGILAGCGGEDAVATTASTTKEITTTTVPAPVTTTASPVTTTLPVTTEPDQPNTEPETTEAPVTTAPVDCVHDRLLSTCPYCNCEKHSWSYSDSTATCTEDGIRERTCDKCSYVEIIEIKAYGHNYHFGRCGRCGYTLPPLEITIPIPDAGEMSADVEAEIKDAYAKQYDEDPKELSVEFVSNLGNGAYAIFVDGPWEYPCMEEEHIVHGYLFWYSSGRTMWIYKDGAVYGLSKAYEQGVIDANQVLDLYLIYADQKGYLSVRNPEKYYTWATIEDNFEADKIIIVVFPEYTLYPYTVEDFAEIGCVELRNLWFDEDDPTEARIISLTLDKNSKQNVLDCIKILEHRADLESAEPSFNIEIID